MYENLINEVIDKASEEFSDFPDSLNGEIYLGGDMETGWRTQVANPPIINITSITNKQGRLQLLALGKYADVQTAIDSLPSPQKEQAQIEYDFSPTWSITDPTLLSLLGALGIADTDLQTLFNEASKL
jgi:hypothetical protein